MNRLEPFSAAVTKDILNYNMSPYLTFEDMRNLGQVNRDLNNKMKTYFQSFNALSENLVRGTRKLLPLVEARLISPEPLLDMNPSQRKVLSQLLRHGLPQLEGAETSDEYFIAFNQAKEERLISPEKVEKLVRCIKSPELSEGSLKVDYLGETYIGLMENASDVYKRLTSDAS